MLLLQMDVRMVHTYAVLVTYALLLVSHKYLCIKASFQPSAGDTDSLQNCYKES
jgi:Ni,Fe-hydrogenase I cytochrome b subunit